MIEKDYFQSILEYGFCFFFSNFFYYFSGSYCSLGGMWAQDHNITFGHTRSLLSISQTREEISPRAKISWCLGPGPRTHRAKIREVDHTGDHEFPCIQFANIITATGNFSKTFMIGHGGFGNVYKVYT